MRPRWKLVSALLVGASCTACAVGGDPDYSVTVTSGCRHSVTVAVVGERELHGDPSVIDSYLTQLDPGESIDIGTTEGSSYIVVKEANAPVQSIIEVVVSQSDPNPQHALTQPECDGFG